MEDHTPRLVLRRRRRDRLVDEATRPLAHGRRYRGLVDATARTAAPRLQIVEETDQSPARRPASPPCRDGVGADLMIQGVRFAEVRALISPDEADAHHPVPSPHLASGTEAIQGLSRVPRRLHVVATQRQGEGAIPPRPSPLHPAGLPTGACQHVVRLPADRQPQEGAETGAEASVVLSRAPRVHRRTDGEGTRLPSPHRDPAPHQPARTAGNALCRGLPLLRKGAVLARLTTSETVLCGDSAALSMCTH